MNIWDLIEKIRADFSRAVKDKSLSDKEIIELKNKFLGRKGMVADLFSQMKDVPFEDRPKVGNKLNQLKNDLGQAIDNLLAETFRDKSYDIEKLDYTLPGDFIPVGSIHPIESSIQEIKEIFGAIGFNSVYGPEIDDDYHNFEALNIPHHHPARDMQDTFYIAEDIVLRTHTSNTQIHVMENQEPPLRVIVPGRVYRNEAISVRSYCLFHQIEGLYVGKDVSFAELKGTLEYFAQSFFGMDVKTRFRPSYFPFTEPSAEVDVSCIFCNGQGCNTCKRTGWLEILGCGMVDPAVFEKVGYDPEIWSGYAFGMGIERLAMLKYGINDIRLFFNGDVRFLRQFR
ncbi:MAG: phenylalanine--tRNA ligase subunit alpha [Fidelibacterota bacterium]